MRQGDIIGVHDDSRLSRTIRYLTGGGPLSHVAIAISDDCIVEAVSPCVKPTMLSRRLSESTEAWLIEPLFLTDSQRLYAARKACSMIGREYGYIDLAWQGLDALFHTDFFCRRFAEIREPICSMMVELCEPADGFNSKLVTPNQFYYTAKANPQRWRATRIKP